MALVLWDRLAPRENSWNSVSGGAPVLPGSSFPVADSDPRARPVRRAKSPGHPVGVEESPVAAPPASEEERSARNERLFGRVESEKRRLGVARLIAKNDRPPVPRPSAVAAQAPIPVPDSSLKVRVSPAGLVLRDTRALAGTWTAAGLPGAPPSADFPAEMVLLLTSSGKITGVENNPSSIVVRYRPLPRAAAASRVKVVAASPLPVVFISDNP